MCYSALNFLDSTGNPSIIATYSYAPQAPFTPRYAMAGGFFKSSIRYGPNLRYRGRVVIVGGLTSPTSATNEIWLFHLDISGFIHWTAQPAIAPFSPRGRMGFVYQSESNSLFIVGGVDPSTQTLFNDVYQITIQDESALDPNNALQCTAITQAQSQKFSPRFSSAVAILDNILFVISGQSVEGVEQDIWATDLPAIDPALVYTTYPPYLNHTLV